MKKVRLMRQLFDEIPEERRVVVRGGAMLMIVGVAAPTKFLQSLIFSSF